MTALLSMDIIDMSVFEEIEKLRQVFLKVKIADGEGRDTRNLDTQIDNN